MIKVQEINFDKSPSNRRDAYGKDGISSSCREAWCISDMSLINRWIELRCAHVRAIWNLREQNQWWCML